MLGAVGVDEGLQPGQVGVGVLLVVDLDADTELVGDGRRVQPELGGVLGEGRVPFVGVGDASDREHHADAVRGEVLHDLGCHAPRDPVHRGGVVRAVQELQRLDEAEDDEVDGGPSVTAVDQPVVHRVELGDAAHAPPGQKSSPQCQAPYTWSGVAAAACGVVAVVGTRRPIRSPSTATNLWRIHASEEGAADGKRGMAPRSVAGPYQSDKSPNTPEPGMTKARLP
ncbi:hypothetical protein [Streptomyces sp. FIT100]|uniref:hypothetical protein n=1 Tax=Streptomyces sp. FIT100 TaxID=2837956 RepID=UPI0021C930C5|nr:hypothetical protein [Streptomyces sp. FIT100]UUN27181.1 hypothetical protein KK483_12795 [Streptomyces sp. FIT100]